MELKYYKIFYLVFINMNYCLLEDAWGKEKHNHITKQYKEYNNSINQQTVEHFNEEPKIKYNYSYNCNDFMNHINNCRTCSNRLREKYKSKVLNNIQDIILNNKEPIVLVLMGIFILLFFNLIYNLTKN
jgi:hypothetical protein